MTHSYHDIAFTSKVMTLQSLAGSRENYAAMAGDERYANELTPRETEFIARRDSFYIASVSEEGWPYVQHRGGPAGFMKVLDEKTLGFADYSGNRQYVSTGNLQHDDRVSLFFMDYPNRRRLKMFGRARVVNGEEQDVLARLQDADYPAPVERAFVVAVEGFDWNCPAHITPRFTEVELESILVNPAAARRTSSAADSASGAATPAELGTGSLALVVTALRQLTPRVRAYELRHPEGEALPAVQAGAHLLIPVRLPSGEITERHYSIASNPARSDVYEIAVQQEEKGTGGSKAVHDSFTLGMILRVDPPANHFHLHTDSRPALLIAGGIGITPIKAMAQTLDRQGAEFHLHYAGRNLRDMAYRDRLERQLSERITVYGKEDGAHLDLESTLASAPADTVVYVCGPERLVAGVLAAARAASIPPEHVRAELFT